LQVVGGDDNHSYFLIYYLEGNIQILFCFEMISEQIIIRRKTLQKICTYVMIVNRPMCHHLKLTFETFKKPSVKSLKIRGNKS